MPSAPDAIVALVERIHHNLDYYHRPDYNETQVRREFIDPLFLALGWDVDNARGLAPQYQEVIHEDSLRVQGSVRSPDYSFRVGPERKFFVEAKKPSVDIRHDVQPAYQLRRYAWTAKLPLSILTDFAEFSVYDCRVRPKPDDKAATARILYITYDQYIDRWDEIASIFSHDAVWRGDYDRYAEAAHGKHGTQEVDAAFLAEIEKWREMLARNIALRNPGLGVRNLNYAVQQTIDRIIFLRICEDRGIEPPEQLRNAINGGDVYARLVEIFRRADDRYNSGLFHFRQEKGRDERPDTLTPALHVDDKVLADIIGGLYYPQSPYAFDVLGADILGNVYEQFLGSVIRLTPSHRAVVEQKPEVRKAGGVYYTPKYIVDYIVEQTLGALCAGKSPGQIARLRVLDPACGSGSFLLGAYAYLLNYHLNWYVEHPTKQERREIYQGRGGQWFLTTEEKKRILLNNIYGVDIDPQAVEVTKLSLLLKVLEGENQETLGRQMAFWEERVLPDLANNIKCGNSLIGTDYYAQATLLDEDEMYRVNPFDWQTEFPDIMRAGGFDAVIGNPPYIRIQTMKEWAPLEVEHYKQKYVSASKGNYDIYVVFVEKGLSLLNANGRLGYILPHKFFNAQYGESLRGLLAEGKHLAEVVHFGDQQVFAGATTYTCLLFLDKAGRDKAYIQKVADLEAWRANRTATAGHILAKHITAGEWNFVVGPGAELFERLSKMPVKLGHVAHIFQGLVTGADKVFILENSQQIEGELLHPYLRGDSLKPYELPRTSLSILFPYYLSGGKATLIPQEDMQKKYPEAWKYLKSYEKTLRSRERGKWNHDQWYAYGRSQNLTQMADPKLIIQVMSLGPRWIYDDRGLYITGGGSGPFYGLRPRVNSLNIFYLLGLLNSDLFGFVIASQSTQMRGGYIKFSKQYIEKAPIRTINFDDSADVARHDQMVALVERMLALHEQVAAAGSPTARRMLERQIEAIDRQIDALVYELYGLTDEEVRIVEGEGRA